MKNKNKSEHQIRIGLVKVNIIRKRIQGNPSFSFKLERLFRDGEIWRKSSRLDRSDLLVASKALEMAFEWVEAQENT